MKRALLSDGYSLFIRKYVLSTLSFIVAMICLQFHFTGHLFFVILFFVTGIFYVNLRKIAFDDTFVYIGRKKFSYHQIQKIRVVELNLLYFPGLKIRSNNQTFWYFTDVGKAGLLRILLGEIFPSLDPLKSIKLFFSYYEQHQKKKGLNR